MSKLLRVLLPILVILVNGYSNEIYGKEIERERVVREEMKRSRDVYPVIPYKTFKNINFSVKFIDDVGNVLHGSRVELGSRVRLVIEVENMTDYDLKSPKIEIVFPKHSGIMIPSSEEFNLSEFNSSNKIPMASYNEVERKFTIDIDEKLFHSKSSKRVLTVPVQISKDCGSIIDAMSNYVVVNANFLSTISTEIETVSDYAEMELYSESCDHLEYKCDGMGMDLSLMGKGYESYKYSLDGGNKYTEVKVGENDDLKNKKIGIKDPGVYKIEKIAYRLATEKEINSTDPEVKALLEDRGGKIYIKRSNVETIKVLDENGFGVNVNPIILQADVYTHCELNKEQVVGHFYICPVSGGESGIGTNTSIRKIRIPFYSAKSIVWQRYKQSSIDKREAEHGDRNCTETDDSNWITLQGSDLNPHEQSFDKNRTGEFRVKIVSTDGCAPLYLYFNVYATELNGVVKGYDQTDSVLANIAVQMYTKNVSYTYILRDVAGREISREVKVYTGQAEDAVDHPNRHTFKNISLLDAEQTFKVEVYSSVLGACVFEKEVKLVDRTTVKAAPTSLVWEDCNHISVKFDIKGGVEPYKASIYSVNDVSPYSNKSLADIPGDKFVSIGNKSENVIFMADRQNSEYRFIIRDAAGNNIVTKGIAAGVNNDFMLNVVPTDANCYGEKGSLKLSLGRKLEESVMSMSVDDVKLYRLDAYNNEVLVDSRAEGIQVARSGITGVPAGRYVVRLKAYGIPCEFSSVVEIQELSSRITADVGLVEDISCSKQDPKLFTIVVNNVQGGDRVGNNKGRYEYKFPSDKEWKLSNVGYENNSGEVEIRNVGSYCSGVKIPFTVESAVQKPIVTGEPKNIYYSCDGNATFMISPTTPTGKKYKYKYEVLDPALSKRSDGIKRNGYELRYTTDATGNRVAINEYLGPVAPENKIKEGAGVFSLEPRVKANGDPDPYDVLVYYTDEELSTKSKNVLYSDDFGYGADSESDKAVGTTFDSSKQELSEGFHKVTEKVNDLLGTLRSPTALPRQDDASKKGRFLAIMPTSSRDILYEFEVRGIQPNKTLNLSFDVTNLVQNEIGGKGSTSLTITCKIDGFEYTRTTSTIQKYTPLSGSEEWQRINAEFVEMSGVSNVDRATIRIKVNNTNSAIALDNIKVTQDPKMCVEPLKVSIAVVPGHGFKVERKHVYPAGCSVDNNGKVVYVVKEFGGESLGEVEYSVDNSWVDDHGVPYKAVNMGRNRDNAYEISISVPRGNHQINVRQQGCKAVPVGTVSIGAADVVKVKMTGVQGSGCGDSYKASIGLKITGGLSPYKDFKYRKKGDSVWITQATPGNGIDFKPEVRAGVATISGLKAGEYEFHVGDQNDCDADAVSGRGVVEPPYEVVFDVDYAKCYKGELMDGWIEFKMKKDPRETADSPQRNYKAYLYYLDVLEQGASEPEVRELGYVGKLEGTNIVGMKISGLSKSKYKLEIRDAMTNCSKTVDILIPHELELELPSSPVNLNCDTTNPTKIHIVSRGGVGKKRIEWYEKGISSTYRGIAYTDGGNFITKVNQEGYTDDRGKTFPMDADITVRKSGTFKIKVTDENGCEAEHEITVLSNKPRWVEGLDLYSEDIVCDNIPTGALRVKSTRYPRGVMFSITSHIEGGLMPKAIVKRLDISGNELPDDVGVTGLKTGRYRVYIRDSFGCETAPREFEVKAKEAPVITGVDPNPGPGSNYKGGVLGVTCNPNGGSDYGKISILVEKGVGPYIVDIRDANNNPVFDNQAGAYIMAKTISNRTIFEGLAAGKYKVIVRDQNTKNDTYAEGGSCISNKDFEVPGNPTSMEVKWFNFDGCLYSDANIYVYSDIDGSPLDIENVRIAYYKGGDPSDANKYPEDKWIKPSRMEDFISEKGPKKAIVFERKNWYTGYVMSVVMRTGNCYTIFDGTIPGKGPFLPPKSTDSLPFEFKPINACGDSKGGAVITISNLKEIRKTYNYIGVGLFVYPYTTAERYKEISISDPNLPDKLDIPLENVSSGEYYMMIYPLNGTYNPATGEVDVSKRPDPKDPTKEIDDYGCLTMSGHIKIEKSSSPLKIESVELLSKQACGAPATAEVTISGGKGKYKYWFAKEKTAGQIPSPSADDWSKAPETSSSKYVNIGELKGQKLYADTTPTWYAFVKDALGCVVSQKFEVKKEPELKIASAVQYNKIGEACTFNGTHKVLVTLSNPGKISEGRKHSFMIARASSGYDLEQAPTPVDFVKTPSGDYPRDASGKPIYQVIIPNIWTDTKDQMLKVLDSSGCGDVTFFRVMPNFDFRLHVNKLLTCNAGDEDAEVTIKDIQNFDFDTVFPVLNGGPRYIYEVFRVKPNGDAEDRPLIGRTAITKDKIESAEGIRFKLKEPGHYRVRVLDMTRPDCPVNTNKPGVTRDITIQPTQAPLFEMPISYPENCYGTQAVGQGTGFVRISTGHLSLAPFSYRIERAIDIEATENLRRTTGNPSAEVTIPVPAEYTREYKIGEKVQGVIEVSGTAGETDIKKIQEEGQSTVVTYDGLMGKPGGVRYIVKAKSGITDCEQEIQVTIKSLNKIKIADKSILVNQYECDGTNTMQSARISVNPAAVSGGTGVYGYRFFENINGTPTVVQDSPTPFLIINKQEGGKYSLQAVDSNGCTSDMSEEFKIGGYVSAKTLKASVKKTMTCETNLNGEVIGEDITLKLETNPTDSQGTKFSYTVRGVNNQYIKSVTGSVQKNIEFTGLGIGSYTITMTNETTHCSTYANYDVRDPNSFVIKAERDKSNPKSGRVTCNGGDDGEVVLTFVDTDMGNGDQSQAGFSYVVKDFDTNRVIPNSGITKEEIEPNKYIIKGLKAGRYRISGKSNSTYCVTPNESVFSIRQAPLGISANATQEYGATCSNDKGEILLDITGGVIPYKVKISGKDLSTGNAVKLDVNQTPEDKSDDVTEYEVEVYNKYLFSSLAGGESEGSKVEYKFEVTDSWGCSTVTGLSPVQVEQPYQITSSPVASKTTCEDKGDGKIEFKDIEGGSGPGTYFYQVKNKNSGKTYPIQTGPIFEKLEKGEYELIAIDKWNCMYTGTVNVEDPDPIQMTVTKKPELVCFDDVYGTSIGIDILGGTPNVVGAELQGYTVRLLNADRRIVKQKQVTGSSVEIEGLFPGIQYEIRITDPQGCEMRLPYQFMIPSIPDLSAKVEYDNRCDKSSGSYGGRLAVTFNEMVDNTKVKYVMNGEDISQARPFDSFEFNTAYITDRQVLKGAPNNQYLTIFYEEGGKQCMKKSNMFFIPNVIELVAEQDKKSSLDANEIKVDGKFGVGPYKYTFNGVSQEGNNIYKVRVTDPDSIDPATGMKMKKIEAVVEDSLGCTSSVVVYYEYLDIEIPRYFTPTGDGINDGWKAKNSSLYTNSLMSIYDRSGRLIIQMKEGESWDGKYNGVDMPSGDYWYIYDLWKEDNNRVFTGHFTLFR